VAINNIGINAQSFGVKRNNGGKGGESAQETQITDGFQSSGASPAEAATKAEITLTVTPSQLQSQAFQSTMAGLAASGVPVQIVMVAEGSLAPTPQPQPQAKPRPEPPAQPAYTPPAPAPAPRHRTPSFGSD